MNRLKMKGLVLLFGMVSLTMVALPAFSQSQVVITSTASKVKFNVTSSARPITQWIRSQAETHLYRAVAAKKRNHKLNAVILAVLLGPFGVHRLYLGTTPKVPIFYSVTLGGLGILPLTDIIAILLTPDMSVFLNNNQIIMWGS